MDTKVRSIIPGTWRRVVTANLLGALSAAYRGSAWLVATGESLLAPGAGADVLVADLYDGAA